jgi:hypothetical protein
MKFRILLFLLCIMHSSTAVAQQYEYVPFPTENTTWKSDEFSGFCENPIGYCGSHIYSTGEELIINDTTYIGIYAGYLGDQVGPVAAMRVQEDSINHKVFIRSVNNPHKEVLLYDFDLEVGDTLPFIDWLWYESNGDQEIANSYEAIAVSLVDTININNLGVLRKRFHLERHAFDQSWPVNLTIIEGIGATAGLGVGIDFSEFEHSYQLQCLRHNDAFVYGYTLSEEALEYYYQFGYQYCAPPVGIEELEKREVLFYPNPVVGNRLFCNELLRIREVRMWSMLGEVIPVRLDADGITIPKNLSSGIYLLQIQLQNSQVSYQRIVKS